MKYIFFFLINICLISCSFFGGGTNIEKLDGCKKVKEILIKKLSPDLLISSITLVSQQDLNTTSDMIQVYEAGDKEEVKLHTFITTYDKATESTFHNFNKGEGGIKLKAINENYIFQNVEKVKKMIPANYEFASIKEYVQSYSNAKEGKATVTVHCTPKDGSTKFKGKKIETTYYALKFEIDASGNAVLKDE